MHPVIWMLIAFAVLATFVGFIRISEIGAEARRREEQAKTRAAAAKAPPPAPTPPMRSYPGDLERPYRHAPAVHPHALQSQPGMSTTDAVIIGLVIGGAFESSSRHHHHDGGGSDCCDDGSGWCC